MEDADSTGVPYVMISEPASSEAEHIYDHFFRPLKRSTYSSDAIADIQSRRSHPDLAGRLFYDELLALTLVNRNDENADFEEQQDPISLYPPVANDAKSIVKLIDIIQSSSFDRIKRMALWYYLMLDLDVDGDLLTALQLAKEMRLPDSARHAMTGYWLLDKGQYPAAVSYLTDQPDFVAKILRTISPLQYTSTSRLETQSRALATSYFLSSIDVEALAVDGEDSIDEIRIVATCWTEGVRTAWVQANNVANTFLAKEQLSFRSRWIGRILEFCFMPQSRDDAVKSLLALPLSEEDEELLSHCIINIPTGVQFTAYAHAVALDVLLVRRINSGQYYEALVLDRRINARMGLPHLARDVTNDEERTKLRKLRTRREGLIKSAYLVMTRMERQLLEVGEGETGEKDHEDMSPSPDEVAEQEMSWERVDRNATASTPKKMRSSMVKPLTPLSASSAIRKDHGNLSVSESFLNAVAKASPKQGERLRSRQSGTASPLSQSMILRANKSGSRTASLLLQHNDSPQRTPSRHALSTQGQLSIGQSSPLATARPYSLQQQRESPRPNGKEAPHPKQNAMEEDDQDAERTVSGSHNHMIEEVKMDQDQDRSVGDLNVDRILSIKSPFKTLQSTSKSSNQNRQASLTFAKPSHRYEARYEITDGSNVQKPQRPRRTFDEDHEEETAEMTEVPKRRGGRSGTKRGRGKGPAMSRAKEQEQVDDDESIPGSFPAIEESQQQASEKSPNSPAKRKTAGRTRSKLLSQQRNHNDDDDDEDDKVPELPTMPNIRKSRSVAGGLTRSKSASKMTSTPIRRSARLSVEPEGTPRTEINQSKRTRRATSKGPSIASASEREETENDEDTTTMPSRRTRRNSKMPGAL